VVKALDNIEEDYQFESCIIFLNIKNLQFLSIYLRFYRLPDFYRYTVNIFIIIAIIGIVICKYLYKFIYT
jgi:hypothetical protein